MFGGGGGEVFSIFLTRSNAPLAGKVGRVGVIAQGLDRGGLGISSHRGRLRNGA